MTIPEEYRGMIMNNIINQMPMEMIVGASTKTLSRMRMKVIIEVAHNTGLIDDYEYQEARK